MLRQVSGDAAARHAGSDYGEGWGHDGVLRINWFLKVSRSNPCLVLARLF